ncbi:hypothetical protein CBM2637_A250157 [Cupriavidus taiwanensis]|nr:hypothetical protein CBM2637_A250157 [Cupriavidus taiwanensis]
MVAGHARGFYLCGAAPARVAAAAWHVRPKHPVRRLLCAPVASQNIGVCTMKHEPSVSFLAAAQAPQRPHDHRPAGDHVAWRFKRL